MTGQLLFVDDEPFLCTLFRIGLKQRNLDVVTAESGKSALAILDADTEKNIKVLFTDINLGTEMTGWELVDRCRDLRPDIVIMILTAESDNSTAGKEKVERKEIFAFFDKISSNQVEMFDACEKAMAPKIK